MHSAILKASSNATTDKEIELKQEIIRLEAEITVMDEKLEEISKARNEAVASERRVRRGLYRLASGRMTLEDVLKVCSSCSGGFNLQLSRCPLFFMIYGHMTFSIFTSQIICLPAFL